jgi:phospholipid/cholesterol/gamma-HCH transport system substrate-binding protein
MVLEDLIGQFLYKSGNGNEKKDDSSAAPEANGQPAPAATTTP